MDAMPVSSVPDDVCCMLYAVCCVVLCDAVRCFVILCYTVLYCVMLRNGDAVLLCCFILSRCYVMLLCDAARGMYLWRRSRTARHSRASGHSEGRYGLVKKAEGVTRCFKGVPRVLRECYKYVTVGPLQKEPECSKGVTRVLQVCYRWPTAE
jgi:hypothetical protein